MGRHAAKPTRRVVGVKSGSKPPHRTSAVADLQLVVHNRRLLLACALAVVLPFGAYFAVIVLTGKVADWALFLFAPMIVVGVSIGALLDRAYARKSREASALLHQDRHVRTEVELGDDDGTEADLEHRIAG